MAEQNKAKKKKSVMNIVMTILVIVVVILAVALVGVRLFGIQPYTVLSGSMEPTYHVGSLVYTKPVDYKTLKEGDTITFMLDEDTVATHRIVEVIPDEEDPEVLRFRTKGDANDSADGGLVHYKNVIGKVIFSIPFLGYLANYVQHPPGTFIAIAAVIIILLLAFLPDLFDKKEKDKQKQEQQEDPE